MQKTLFVNGFFYQTVGKGIAIPIRSYNLTDPDTSRLADESDVEHDVCFLQPIVKSHKIKIKINNERNYVVDIQKKYLVAYLVKAKTKEEAIEKALRITWTGSECFYPKTNEVFLGYSPPQTWVVSERDGLPPETKFS